MPLIRRSLDTKEGLEVSVPSPGIAMNHVNTGEGANCIVQV